MIVLFCEAARLTRCVGNENVIAISSKRYKEIPLVVQGPAAGKAFRSSGLFTDLLRLSRALVEWTIPKIS